MVEKTKQVEVLADNYQFVIVDQNANDDLSNIWDDQTTLEKLAVRKSTVSIGTQINYVMTVVVNVLDKAPEINIDEWEHITESSIFLESGNLCINAITDHPFGPPIFNFAPGYYRIMALHRGLIPLHLNDDDTPEECKVIIWPSEYEIKKIIKQWEEPE